jgi:hypothetical protein
MRGKQCKVQDFNAKASPFPKSTKTKCLRLGKGSTKVKEIRLYKRLQLDTKELLCKIYN